MSAASYRIGCRVVASLVPGLLAVAAPLKIATWPEYVNSLQSFVLLPQWSRSLVAIGVPVLETVPLALLCVARPRLAGAVAVALLVACTGAIYLHKVNNIEPDCACFGKWVVFEQRQADASRLLTRKSVFLAIALCGFAASFSLPIARRGGEKELRPAMEGA